VRLPCFRIRLVTCVVAAALAGCGAPAQDPTAVETAGEPALEQAPAAPSPAPRRERRPAREPSPPTAYRYIDETGRVQIASALADIPERQRDTAVPIPGAGSRPGVIQEPRTMAEATRPANSVDVTIYSTRSCGYCRAAIAYFEKKGVDYMNRDVQEDPDAREDYIAITNGRLGVPVIVVGNEWMQGWNRQTFEKLLKASQ
jgi:glutaredoxin 3